MPDRCGKCGRFVGFYPVGFYCDHHCKDCICPECPGAEAERPERPRGYDVGVYRAWRACEEGDELGKPPCAVVRGGHNIWRLYALDDGRELGLAVGTLGWRDEDGGFDPGPAWDTLAAEAGRLGFYLSMQSDADDRPEDIV